MPAQLPFLADCLQIAYRFSERKACEAITVPTATHRYQSVADERAALRVRLRDLAHWPRGQFKHGFSPHAGWSP